MATLIQMLRPAIECLLFAQGPRLSLPGYRWAPKTILSPYGLNKRTHPASSAETSDFSARLNPCLDPFGLHVSLPTIRFDMGEQSPSPQAFVLKIGQNALTILLSDGSLSDWEHLVPLATEGRIFLVCYESDLEKCPLSVLLLKEQNGPLEWRGRYLFSATLMFQTNASFGTRDSDAEAAKVNWQGEAVWVEDMPRWCID